MIYFVIGFIMGFIIGLPIGWKIRQERLSRTLERQFQETKKWNNEHHKKSYYKKAEVENRA